MEKADIRNFDVISYLKTKGISIYYEGKNVSPGWIGIKCVWCSDKSNHLGINLRSKALKCWKCKKTGTVLNLIQTLEQCSWDQAEDICLKYFEYYIPEKITTFVPKIKPEDVLPKQAFKEPLQMHIDYLKGRNFDVSEIRRKYQILFTDHRAGRLKFRIIVPVIMDRTIVSFTARDVTGSAELRYIDSKKEEFLVDPDSVFYNIDTVSDTAFIVEGVTDVWRLGDGACATLGTEFNNHHIHALVSRGVKRAFWIYDPEPEAQKLAKRGTSMLSVSIPQVENIELNSGDPGSLSPREAYNLKRDLLR